MICPANHVRCKVSRPHHVILFLLLRGGFDCLRLNHRPNSATSFILLRMSLYTLHGHKLRLFTLWEAQFVTGGIIEIIERSAT